MKKEIHEELDKMLREGPELRKQIEELEEECNFYREACKAVVFAVSKCEYVIRQYKREAKEILMDLKRNPPLEESVKKKTGKKKGKNREDDEGDD